MISAQEMVKEVNNYRDDNKKIVEEYFEEISNRIQAAAKRGEREKDINLWDIASYIPSNKRKRKTLDDTTECPSAGLQETIWDKLREKGFTLEPSMGLDGYNLKWARIVKW